MPTSQSATTCLPKLKSFGHRQNSTTPSSPMISFRVACDRPDRLTRPSVYLRRRQSWNANAVKLCGTGSRSCAPAWHRPRLIAAPKHGHGSRETATHVKREIAFRVLNLTRARLFGQVLISFYHLPDAGCADGMTIPD